MKFLQLRLKIMRIIVAEQMQKIIFFGLNFIHY